MSLRKVSPGPHSWRAAFERALVMVDSGATVSRKRPAVQLGEHWAGGSVRSQWARRDWALGDPGRGCWPIGQGRGSL